MTNVINSPEVLSEVMQQRGIIIYLQSECIEKYQFEICSKYDREYDFDVILV